MEQRRVGRSGLTVSTLGLGTMTWGRDTDADEAAAQLEAFVDAGGTLVETANVYGDGEAEAIIGTLVPDVVPRSSVTVAVTTVGATGRGALLRELDASLGRLGFDEVDLWLIQDMDPAVPYAETCSALTMAVGSGRARYAGVSGLPAWQLATIATKLQYDGMPAVATANEYSLLARHAEDAVLPAAAAHGMGLLAWGPLGRGVLTGKYRHGTPADSRGASPQFELYVAQHRTERAARVVEAVATAADGLGTSPVAVSCAWVRDRPGVAAAVVGARTAAQLTGVLAGHDIVLPAEIRRALDDVSAAPPAGGDSGRRVRP